MKKKILSVLVILLALFTLVGCNKDTKTKETEQEGKGEVAGGWQIDTSAKTLQMSNEAKTAFEKAIEEYDGVDLKPIALLGTQVVAGTNYMYLCTSTPVTQNPKTSYAIVIVYKDLKGKSEITAVEDFDYTKYTNVKAEDKEDEEVTGGWTVYDKTSEQELSEKVQKIFDDSMKELTGATYKPIALLGTQVVAGTNYSVIALETTTTKTPKNYISVLTIYEDLNEESKVSSIVKLDLADFNK